jgi:hypothetical protein
VPGGIRREISAGKAAAILEQVTPSGPAARARCELAAEFLAGVRRLDAQLREGNQKPAAAVRASGTSLTGLFGAGPVIAGTVTGDVRQVFGFPGRDHFAAWNGTAPVEVSPGDRKKVCRLSLRSNRRVNHAIHMAAISQIRHQRSDGRAYYEKKAAEGKAAQGSAALPQPPDQRRHLRRTGGRCPARPSSRRLPGGPGRATGEPLCIQGGRLTPRTPALRTSHSQAPPPHYGCSQHSGEDWAFPGRCHPAAGEAADPGGAPAAKRGRTTWRYGEATAILRREEGPDGSPTLP